MMFEEEHLFTAKNILFSSLLLVIVSCGSLQRSSKKYHDIAERNIPDEPVIGNKERYYQATVISSESS